MTRILPAIGCLFIVATGTVSADTDVERLSQALRESPRSETIHRLLPTINEILRDEESAPNALPVIERAVEILRPGVLEKGDLPIAAMLLKSAARIRFAQQEPDKAAVHLQALRDVYQSLRQNPKAEVGDAQAARWAFEVALEYLRGEQTSQALEVLAELADRDLLERHAPDEYRAAVAGALNRRLEQMDTEQRFELLRAWTLPIDGKRALRVMTALASVEAPPDVFARALGKRPRAGAFPIPRVGDVDGLFSTAWLLVRAAAASGRSKQLTTDLEALAKKKAPHAADVLLLARIAEKSATSADLRDKIEKPLAQEDLAGRLMYWISVGAACLERKELQPLGQRTFEAILARLDPASAAQMRPFLRRARAIAIVRQSEVADRIRLEDPGLKFWAPAGEERAGRSAAGAVRGLWLAHEGHLLHLAGPHNDYLCFRYPLRGEFAFDVETQYGDNEHAFGNIAFGGLALAISESSDEVRVSGLELGQAVTRPCQFVRKEQWPTYVRMTVRSTDNAIEFAVNGHPVWSDPPTKADSIPNSTSPWLALRCLGNFIPAFRNFRLTGSPEIPREVRLSDGNLLRGWFTQFYPSHVSPTVSMNGVEDANTPPTAVVVSRDGLPSLVPTEYDWSIRDGVIHGSQRGEMLRSAVPNRLTYFRPLQNGESVSYEFLHEPGKHEVHPTLGRLAFLIEPSGVRIHWLTSGDADWTGLPETNAVTEPLSRRGPRPAPLKAGEWNRLTTALANDTLTLSLNDVEIYSRKMEPENSRRFGLFYDRSRSAAQVRNVMLRGDWPERLSEEEANDLLAPR